MLLIVLVPHIAPASRARLLLKQPKALQRVNRLAAGNAGRHSGLNDPPAFTASPRKYFAFGAFAAKSGLADGAVPPYLLP